MGKNRHPLPLTLTAYPTPTQGRVVIFFSKRTPKDDPTISCSHLVAETSVLAAWKNIPKGVVTIPKGVVTTPFGRRGLIVHIVLH